MARYKMVVLTRPVEGREDEFNDWYQNTHLADVVAVDGFVGAQRFRASNTVMADDPFPYLAIYDVETDDPAAVLADLNSRAGTDRMYVSDALSPHVYAVMYAEFGEPVKA